MQDRLAVVTNSRPIMHAAFHRLTVPETVIGESGVFVGLEVDITLDPL